MFKKLSVFVLLLSFLCALAGCNQEQPAESSSMEPSFILEVSGEASKEASEESSEEGSSESPDLPDGELTTEIPTTHMTELLWLYIPTSLPSPCLPMGRQKGMSTPARTRNIC